MRSTESSRTRMLLAAVIATLALIPTNALVAESPEQQPAGSEQRLEGASAKGTENLAEVDPAEPASRYVVYYLHGERRCRTCRTIEAYAEKVVRSRFAKELKAGSLSWEVVNYDQPENQHFIQDFGLVSASLVVVEMSHENPVRFEVLQKVWSLVRDKPGFEQYVLWSIAEYMDKTG